MYIHTDANMQTHIYAGAFPSWKKKIFNSFECVNV